MNLLFNYLIVLPFVSVSIIVVFGLLFLFKIRNKNTVSEKVEKVDGDGLEANTLELQTEEGAVYDKSFTAKLIQSDEFVKTVYNALKNKLLSYEKVYSHVGWDYDTFRFGRPTIARFTFSGKTPIVCFALPLSVIESYTSVEDYSKKEKYKSVPVGLKITTEKRLKIAIDLIDELAIEFNLIANEKQVEDYLPEDKTEGELLDLGLIKKIANKNVGDLIKERKAIFNKVKENDRV